MSKRAPDKVSPKNCGGTQNDSANTSIERSNRHIPTQNGQNSIITTIFHTYTDIQENTVSYIIYVTRPHTLQITKILEALKLKHPPSINHMDSPVKSLNIG